MNSRELVKDTVLFDSVLISQRSAVRYEKERADGRKQRMYYFAYFKTGHFGKAYSRPMWQEHVIEDGEESCAWRHTLSPEIFDENIGKPAEGVSIVCARLNSKIEAIFRNGEKKMIENVNVVVFPHEDPYEVLDKALKNFGLLKDEPEVVFEQINTAENDDLPF